MLTPEQILAISLASLTLALIPGPDTALILARSVTGGKVVGFATALGCTVALGIHTLLAVLGLSVILTTSAIPFTIVKLLGAGYLIFLGIQAFKNQNVSLQSQESITVSSQQAMVQGFFLLCLTLKWHCSFCHFYRNLCSPSRGQSLCNFCSWA